MADKIMIVDDSRAFRMALSLLLQMEEYEVIEAEDGFACLEQCARAYPDLIIMDINMPRMDGFETIRRVREHSAVPILVLSARDARADKSQGLDAGSDGYLSKPFDIDELLVRIETLLRRPQGQLVG